MLISYSTALFVFEFSEVMPLKQFIYMNQLVNICGVQGTDLHSPWGTWNTIQSSLDTNAL